MTHRARIVCANTQQLHKEEEYISQHHPGPKNHNNHSTNNHNITCNNNENINMLVPYTKGLNQSFKNVCGKVGVQVNFKGDNIITKLLVVPKDSDNITQKSWIIYRYRCDQVDCDDEYIGESARPFRERLKEHLWVSSVIYDHGNTSGHHCSMDITRTIKEAMYIRVIDLSLNRNIGKFQSPTFGMRSL